MLIRILPNYSTAPRNHELSNRPHITRTQTISRTSTRHEKSAPLSRQQSQPSSVPPVFRCACQRRRPLPLHYSPCQPRAKFIPLLRPSLSLAPLCLVCTYSRDPGWLGGFYRNDPARSSPITGRAELEELA